MDPMMQMPQQGAAPADPQALKNAMLLQAIKAGAAGGMSAPGLGQVPTSQASTPPVNPASLPGAGMQQMAGMGQIPQSQLAMLQQQQNPVASALMSPIPGGPQLASGNDTPIPVDNGPPGLGNPDPRDYEPYKAPADRPVRRSGYPR